MTDEEWEELGPTHLESVCLHACGLNDHRISFFFRGLTRSSSIKEMRLLMNNGLSAEGIRSMVPFIQNSNNITYLHLSAQFTIGRIQCAVSGVA